MSTSARTTLFLTAFTLLPLLLPHRAAGELEDAAARGQKLFADASLGTSGMSCSSCHIVAGTGKSPFAGRAPFPKVFSVPNEVQTLEQAVQGCIVGALKGNPLAANDARLTDLVTFVDSLYTKR